MKVVTNNILIETDVLSKEFKEHLDLKNNKRILFSGPFGNGKSTFLKEFSQNVNEDYFYLKIYPVNYSVAANEDVFELIKFDLLFHLLGNYSNEIKLEKEDFTLLLKSQMFIMERMNYMPLLYAILGFSEKIGTPIVDFIKAMKETVGNYKKYSDEIKIDEEQDITSFLKSVEQKQGSHHEMDAVSELIFDLIKRVKVSKKAESVLIIDDLDRLDPDHIFRLFNIFSAHYDDINGKNKFGFDKVIFVCDIENIRKIFHHKYGIGVDFSGYIDKFYSVTPFDFDNRKYIQEKVYDFTSTIEFDNNLNLFEIRNKIFHRLLKIIITSLIETRQLNLRMLINMPKVVVKENYFRNTPNSHSNSTTSTPIIVLFQTLRNFYGSFNILKNALINLKTNLNKEIFNTDLSNRSYAVSAECTQEIISYCLPFIVEDQNYSNDNQPNKNYFLLKLNCTIHYVLYQYSDINVCKFDRATLGDNILSDEIIDLNPFEILLETFEECQRRGLLK